MNTSLELHTLHCRAGCCLKAEDSGQCGIVEHSGRCFVGQMTEEVELN